MPAFEAALQIVEFVKGLEAEREAELYKESGGGSGNGDDGAVPRGCRKSRRSPWSPGACKRS